MTLLAMPGADVLGVNSGGQATDGGSGGENDRVDLVKLEEWLKKRNRGYRRKV